MTPPDLGVRLADIVQYITSAGVLAIIGYAWKSNIAQAEITQRLAVLESLLSNVDNGILPVMAMLRQRTHELGEKIHTTTGKVELHNIRLDYVEGRVTSLEDRRTGADRRKA